MRLYGHFLHETAGGLYDVVKFSWLTGHLRYAKQVLYKYLKYTMFLE